LFLLLSRNNTKVGRVATQVEATKEAKAEGTLAEATFLPMAPNLMLVVRSKLVVRTRLVAISIMAGLMAQSGLRR
jgi:hypothetical protein